jgi:tetratricopeptide (TPR) repeat protein
MRKRLVLGSVAVLLLAAAGVALALYLGGKRDVTTSSDEAYRMYKEALENERRYYYQEAKDGFAKTLALDPQFSEAMLGLARLTDGEQGLALIKRAAKEKARLTEREQLHVDMDLASRQGKWDETVQIARQIHEKYPNDIRAATMLGRREIQNGNTERAIAIFTELLAVEPNNAEAYNQIGYYYAYRGDYDRAIENLRKYQFMAPDQANPYDSLGEIQAYSGHYDEAIENLNQALKRKPDFFHAYLTLGVAYMGKGEYTRAIEVLRKGAHEASENEARREHIRQALRVAFVAGDVGVARQLIAEYQAIPGERHPEVARLLTDAVLDLMEGRPAQAEKKLREVQPKIRAAYAAETHGKEWDESMDDPGTQFLLAQALVRQGKADEAIAICEKMAAPRKVEDFAKRHWAFASRALLAELVARQGDLDRAEKLLAENRKWNPSWAPTRSSEQVVAQLRREKVLEAASK